MNNRLTYPGKLALATSVLLLLCIGFGWWQSGEGRVGGRMSPAKVVWLFLALVHFYLVPFWLWKDPRLSTAWQRVWGVFFLGFLIRAVIEIPMLLLTRAWRCEHGIAHDAIMLAVLGFLVSRFPRMEQSQIRPFAWLAGVALVFEALNAWMFRKIGNPEAGIYFASIESHFRMINLITWCEIAVIFPLFLRWLLKYNCSER